MTQRGQTQGRSYTRYQGRYAEIGGKQYEDHSRSGEHVFMRPLRPNQRPSEDCCATTPHPDPEMRADGWRMEWIFLPLLIVGIIAAVVHFCPVV